MRKNVIFNTGSFKVCVPSDDNLVDCIWVKLLEMEFFSSWQQIILLCKHYVSKTALFCSECIILA